MNKYIKGESGSVMIMLCITLVVLIGLTGLVVDGAQVYLSRSKLQNTADAAALAGASELGNLDKVREKAVGYAGNNGMKTSVDDYVGVDMSDPDGPTYSYTNSTDSLKITSPYKGDPDRVEVECTRTTPTFLMRVLGFSNSTQAMRAVAQKGGVNLEPFNYTLFSGDEIVDVTGNNSTIVGDVYAYEQIGNKHTTIVGDAVVAGNKAKDIDVKDATNKVYNTVEIIPDLWPVVQTQTVRCLNMAEFYNQTDFDEDTQRGFLDHEIVYYDNTSELNLDGCLFEGVGIIFATGPISMDGGGQVSENDSIIFYSNSSASQGAIHFTGSGQNCMGFLYTPNGETKFSGTGADVIGRIISGPQIKFAGGGATIDGTQLNEDVFDMLKKSLVLVE